MSFSTAVSYLWECLKCSSLSDFCWPAPRSWEAPLFSGLAVVLRRAAVIVQPCAVRAVQRMPSSGIWLVVANSSLHSCLNVSFNAELPWIPMNESVISPTFLGNHEDVEITLHTPNTGSLIISHGVLTSKACVWFKFQQPVLCGVSLGCLFPVTNQNQKYFCPLVASKSGMGPTPELLFVF